MADDIESFLSRLQHPMLAGIDLKLDRVQRLLAMLGSPHKRLPPVIHVAGTNGKGSLLANLLGIFEAGGYRVHRYTSPHLVRFRERIVLAGKEIEESYLTSIVRHIAPTLSSQPATFFEATTAIAMLAFAEKKADVLLLETGMGGRLDATNVVEKPALNAITPVALDHCEYLGNTLEAIAAEKAGILRGGISCVVGRQERQAMEVIEAKAASLGALLFRLGKEWDWQQENGTAVYRSESRSVRFMPALAGEHQYDNSATAIACIDRLPEFSLSDAQIAQGIAAASWPARLQKLEGKLAALLPAGVELWLDGGHNPQGAGVLAAWLRTRPKKDVYLICGMMERKDAGEFMAALAPWVRSVHTIAIEGESKCQPPEKLAAIARQAGMEAVAMPSVEKALQTIAAHAKTPSVVCICGSLYLAGRILSKME